MPLTTRAGKLWLADIEDYLRSGFSALGRICAGLVLPWVLHISWPDVATPERRATTGSVLRGTALTAIVLPVFTILLVAADPVFQKLVTSPNWWEFATTIGAIGVTGWWGGSLVWHMLSGDGSPTSSAKSPMTGEQEYSFGAVEGITLLVGLNLLFIMFVAIQARYLFAGVESVLLSMNLSYSEYARRGFFELVIVTAMVLTLLVVLDRMVVRRTTRDEWTFRGAAALMVALTLIMALSAVQRMRLYQEALGLTELRIYTMAFMFWIGVLLVWFCATVLRGHREWFAVGGLVTGFIAVAALNILNPDALIVRANAASPKFDAPYHTALSADATAVLVEALPSLPADARGLTSFCLLERWSKPHPDWRTWNASRAEAVATVAAHGDELRAWATAGYCDFGLNPIRDVPEGSPYAFPTNMRTVSSISKATNSTSLGSPETERWMNDVSLGSLDFKCRTVLSQFEAVEAFRQYRRLCEDTLVENVTTNSRDGSLGALDLWCTTLWHTTFDFRATHTGLTTICDERRKVRLSEEFSRKD